MESILAIDLGTSGAKVTLFAANGRFLAGEAEPVAIFLGEGGAGEQDPIEWWEAIARATRRLVDRFPDDAKQIVAIGTTAQWGGTVAVDGDGLPLGKALIWADSRGAPWVARITDGWPRVEGYGARKAWSWIRRTGGIPTRGGKDAIAHILFLKHERPDIYQQAAHFLDVKDYLNLRLTGRVASSPDTITLYWVTDNRRIDRIDYDSFLLRLSGLDRRTLPDLQPATSILGPLSAQAAQELGLRAGIPVCVGSGDIIAAAVGSGAVRTGEPHIHIGTSAWLSCHLPKKQTDLFHNMATLPSAMPGLYLLVNEQDVAGGALAWLRGNIIFAEDGLGCDDGGDGFERILALAAQAPVGSNGVLFTPWLNGERSPVEDRTVRAGYYNLSLRTTRSDLMRALLEGVALNLAWLLPYVERLARATLGPIRIVGGGARAPLWCQIHADVLNRPILQVDNPQAASGRGAALIAALAIGALKADQIAEAVPVQRTFTPDAAAQARYALLMGAFQQIYRQNRSIYRRLNG